MAEQLFNDITITADEYRQTVENKMDEKLDNFLNDVLYSLISRSLKE